MMAADGALHFVLSNFVLHFVLSNLRRFPSDCARSDCTVPSKEPKTRSTLSSLRLPRAFTNCRLDSSFRLSIHICSSSNDVSFFSNPSGAHVLTPPRRQISCVNWQMPNGSTLMRELAKSSIYRNLSFPISSGSS